MKNHKIWLAISGILLIVLGVLCIAEPAATLFTTAWMIGCFTLFSGITKMVFAFRTEHFMPNSGTRMLSGLLQIILGLIFLTHNMFVAVSLPLVFVMWVIFEGVTLAIQSFEYKKFGFTKWWVLLLLGIIIALLGILGMRYLDVAGMTLTLMIGIGIIILGLANLFALSSINQFEKQVKKANEAVMGE